MLRVTPKPGVSLEAVGEEQLHRKLGKAQEEEVWSIRTRPLGSVPRSNALAHAVPILERATFAFFLLG